MGGKLNRRADWIGLDWIGLDWIGLDSLVGPVHQLEDPIDLFQCCQVGPLYQTLV